MKYIKMKIQKGLVIIEQREDGYAYECFNGLIVIQSEAVEKDGKPWIHTSFSRKSRIPDYRDIKWVKETFVGKEKIAIQILPIESEHVNIHNFCLHLWTPVEHDPLPDFTHGTGSI